MNSTKDSMKEIISLVDESTKMLKNNFPKTRHIAEAMIQKWTPRFVKIQFDIVKQVSATSISQDVSRVVGSKVKGRVLASTIDSSFTYEGVTETRKDPMDIREMMTPIFKSMGLDSSDIRLVVDAV